MAAKRRNPLFPAEPEPTIAPAPAPEPLRLVATKGSLIEPHELLWFHPGKPREVYRLTKWMQAQINAKLLQVV